MHDQSYAVVRLQCHLENQQYTTFRDGEPISNLITRDSTQVFSLVHKSRLKYIQKKNVIMSPQQNGRVDVISLLKDFSTTRWFYPEDSKD